MSIAKQCTCGMQMYFCGKYCPNQIRSNLDVPLTYQDNTGNESLILQDGKSTNDYLNNTAKPEYIICAAIWIKDGKQYVHQPRNIDAGLVIAGRRHHNCFQVIKALGLQYDKTKIHQGFLTSKDRYVDRKEAAIIALEQKQVDRVKKILFSEDLY